MKYQKRISSVRTVATAIQLKENEEHTLGKGLITYKKGDWKVVYKTGVVEYFTNENFKEEFEEVPKQLLFD